MVHTSRLQEPGTNCHSHAKNVSPLSEKGKMFHYRGNSRSDVLSGRFEKYGLNVRDVSVRPGNPVKVISQK